MDNRNNGHQRTCAVISIYSHTRLDIKSDEYLLIFERYSINARILLLVGVQRQVFIINFSHRNDFMI